MTRRGMIGKTAIAGMALLLAAAGAPASAATWPERPISLIVGFSPGGGVDVVGRLLAQKLGEALKATVVVENKAGFSGNIAAQQVKRAAADGYTLLMTPATTYSLSRKLAGPQATGYDLAADFDAVTAVGEMPLVLLAGTGVNVASMAELKTRIGGATKPMTYGSSGTGSIEHVAMEMLRLKTGLQLLHVPYKGSSPAMTDLLGGQIDLAFATAPTALANLPSGRVKAVGVASAGRSDLLPGIASFTEQGVADFAVSSLFMVLAPRGLPADRLAQLNKTLTDILRSPDVVKRLAGLGIDARTTTLPEAAARLQREIDQWGRAIEQTGISVNSN